MLGPLHRLDQGETAFVIGLEDLLQEVGSLQIQLGDPGEQVEEAFVTGQ